MKNIYTFLGLVLFFIGRSYGNEVISGHSVNNSQQQIVDSLQILQEQTQLITELKDKQQDMELTYLVLIGIALFLILLFGVLCFVKKYDHQRLQRIIEQLEETKKKQTNDRSHLDDQTVTAILENLKQFEKERGFLTQKLTLHELAKKLQTNTKYASKVINTYKLQSFRRYINELRIRYSIQQLKTCEYYRKYTIHTMAQEAGFNNKESFTKAFRHQTGTTVSDFVDGLKH